MYSTEKTSLTSALGKGKSSADFKAKDFVRMEDLYRKSRDWIDYLDDPTILHYEDVYDESMRNLQRVTLEKDGPNNTFKVTSYFQADADMQVDDRALAAGVKQMIQKVLEEKPYPKVTRDDLIDWAKARAGNSGPSWLRHL